MSLINANNFGSVAGAAGGLIGSVVNAVSTDYWNRQQMKLHYQDQSWQEQMAAQANQWSIDQWDRENEYNSPTNQMARLREAGINPALAYSNGAFNQAATSPDVQMPSNGQAAHTQPWQVDPMMMSSLATAEAQRDLIKAETQSVKDQNQRENTLLQPKIEFTRSQIKHLNHLSDYLDELSNNVRYDSKYKEALTQKAQSEVYILDQTIQSIISSAHSKAVMDDAMMRKAGEYANSIISELQARAYELSTRADSNKQVASYYEELANYYSKSQSKLNSALQGYYDSLSGRTEKETKYMGVRLFFDGLRIFNETVHTGMEAYSTIITRGMKPTFNISYPNGSMTHF